MATAGYSSYATASCDVWVWDLAAEDDDEGPQIAMTVDLSEMHFGEQPSGGDLALDHVGIAPSRDLGGATRDIALRGFDHVGGGQARIRAGLSKRVASTRTEFDECFYTRFEIDFLCCVTGREVQVASSSRDEGVLRLRADSGKRRGKAPHMSSPV